MNISFHIKLKASFIQTKLNQSNVSYSMSGVTENAGYHPYKGFNKKTEISFILMDIPLIGAVPTLHW